MVKQDFIFILWSVFGSVIYSIESSAIQTLQNSDVSSIMDRIMIRLIREYRPPLKNIVIFDGSRNKTSFSALSVTPSPVNASFYLISKDSTAYKPRDVVGIQGIIVVDDDNLFLPSRIMKNLSRFWPYDKNFTLIVISKPKRSCLRTKGNYLFLNYLHLPIEYFICPQKEGFVIMTRDWYGNRRNPYWNMLNSTYISDKVKVIYYRKFTKDNISDVLEFIRIDKPSIYVEIISPIAQNTTITKPYTLNAESENQFKEQDLYNVRAIEQYWKFKFFYSFIDKKAYPFDGFTITKAIGIGRFDVILSEDLMESHSMELVPSPLINEEDLVIISFKRCPATPLEKIIRFYGRITLISLLVLSTLTLIVIWIKTKFKLAPAIFNTFRLLINTAISVSIDTLPLRIFFSVVFLYFLIMHATFSGHLAKFLTVDTVFDNLESMEDLKDSNIQTIGIPNIQFYDSYSHDKVMARKFLVLRAADDCITKIRDKQIEACIGTRFSSQMLVRKYQLDGKIYISKKQLWTTRATLLYRRNLYWTEKWDRTLLFLIETRIWNWWTDRKRSNIDNEMAERQRNFQVDFRSIDLMDLKFAFMLLIGGNIIGSVCFVTERLIQQLKRKVPTKVSKIDVQPIEQN